MPKPRHRNDQLIRILELVRKLDRHDGATLAELSESLGKTIRTIRRDLEALESAGMPLTAEADGKEKRWRFRAKEHVSRVASLLDASHYLALRVALAQGTTTRTHSGTFATLEDLAQKIETAVGPRGRAELAAIDRCFFSYEKFAYAHAPPDVLWVLVRAITQKKLCRVTYRAASTGGRDKTYEALPLRLFVHDGAVYAWAHVSKHGRVITLNVHRLREVVPLERKAEPPRGFDPDARERSAFGIFTGEREETFRLRFDADVAPFIRERVWHPTQRLRARRDGGVELTFTCTASYEVEAWVASWREHCEVVAPAALRRRMRAMGAWMVRVYGGGRGGVGS